MKSVQDILPSILSKPMPADLIALQGALLASGHQEEAVEQALETTGQFHTYLCELQSKITARDYNELASRLDIGAVGAVALENLIAAEGEAFWKSFLLGALGEGLMIAASRQYIKAWETETQQVHTHAAWHLTEALWRTSVEMQPDLPPEQRWQAIQSLLAPAYAPDVPAPDKAMLLGRIFQILLLSHLAVLFPTPESQPKES
jgi:hypothetical protein